jgi:hypothetical protein
LVQSLPYDRVIVVHAVVLSLDSVCAVIEWTKAPGKNKLLAAWLCQGMSFFAIEKKAKIDYITIAPQGAKVCKIFENLAAGN